MAAMALNPTGLEKRDFSRNSTLPQPLIELLDAIEPISSGVRVVLLTLKVGRFPSLHIWRAWSDRQHLCVCDD